MPRFYIEVNADKTGEAWVWDINWGREDGECTHEEAEVLSHAASDMVRLQAETVDGTAEEE